MSSNANGREFMYLYQWNLHQELLFCLTSAVCKAAVAKTRTLAGE